MARRNFTRSGSNRTASSVQGIMEHSVGCNHCSYGWCGGQTRWAASQDSAARRFPPTTAPIAHLRSNAVKSHLLTLVSAGRKLALQNQELGSHPVLHLKFINDRVGEIGDLRRRRSNRPGNSQAKGPRIVNL